MIVTLFVLVATITVVSYRAGRYSIKKNIKIKLIESEQTIALLTAQQSKHIEKNISWNLYRKMIADQRKKSKLLRDLLPKK